MVYKNKKGNADLMDEYNGYENAFGEDVADMISDEYNISPTAEWYW